MKEYIVNLTDISEYGRRMIIGNGIPKEELIRCKDCKHMHEDGVESYCDDSGRYIDGTGFCKWAERKERKEE